MLMAPLFPASCWDSKVTPMDQDEYGIVHKGVRSPGLSRKLCLFAPQLEPFQLSRTPPVEDPHLSAKTGKSRKHWPFKRRFCLGLI